MNEKLKYKYIFVILVYRNIEDLKECIESIARQVDNYKIIVVNAFYDVVSEASAKENADKYGCDFLSIENRGYSFGNNTGIEYACDKYDFDYIVVSNPDITIEKFNDDVLSNKWGIVAPKIIAADGKKQNPMALMENKMSEKLVYKGLKQNKKFCFLLGVMLNKLSLMLGVMVMKCRGTKEQKIYAAHGSCVMLSKETVSTLGPRLYDENMFLFGEEGVLAQKAKKAGIATYYTTDILVHHKEDGSMKLGNFSVNDELKKANIYYYEHYRM